MIGLLAEYLDV